MQVPKRPALPSRGRRSDQFKKQDDTPVYVTEEGLAKLKRQVERLEAELPAIISEVDSTRSNGDLSDNAEYKEAKYKLRRTQGRIFNLKDRLKRAVVIKKDPAKIGMVQLGSVVVMEVSGKKITFEILGSYESDPVRGRISFQSPLGSALMNRSVGDVVSVQTPKGFVEYRILEIR